MLRHTRRQALALLLAAAAGAYLLPLRRAFAQEEAEGEDKEECYETVSYTHLTLPTTPYV